MFIQLFISKLSRIAATLALMLKTLGNIESITRFEKSEIGISSDGGGNGGDDGGHNDEHLY